MRRIFLGCLREGIRARGFAALDTEASKLFFLEICGSLLTSWAWSVVREPHGHLSLPSQKSCRQSHDEAVGLGSSSLELISPYPYPSVWTGYDPDSSLPRAPFFFKPCVYFMGNFTRLFLILFQLKAQNPGFVRALWWFRFLLALLFLPPKSPQKFNKCCSDICMLNCSK